MEPKALSAILTRHANCAEESGRYLMPESSQASLFASAGDHPLVIERVQAVEFEDDIVVVTTSRDDRYVLLCSDIRALRVNAGGKAAGYGRQ